MDKLLLSGNIYDYQEYGLEKDFEEMIVKHADDIFGPNSVYIDIKKRIGEKDSILSIPDGYLIDFSFEADPRLYIIENELSSHDLYKPIGSQLLKFAIGYKASGRKIKKHIMDYLEADAARLERVESGSTRAGHRNIDAFLEYLIFEKPVAAIVIIDQNSPDLENVLAQLTMDTDIIEFQTFTYQDQLIHKFAPFNAEIREATESPKNNLKPEELNTVVVPAQEDGFEEEFLNNDRWYSIRISASMINEWNIVIPYWQKEIKDEGQLYSQPYHIKLLSHLILWQKCNGRYDSNCSPRSRS
ncbi:hypothetical protein AB9P05_14160 [Roseivirga sp. BDSF3-8]|uniref:hypothetical protein n=1 Tax=Roseivirga sp. BDSF3-8 TaxID=3241598 RepID=UPI003531F3CA